MAEPAPPLPSDPWTRSWQQWLEGWVAASGQPQPAIARAQDPFALWRSSYDQWLEALSTTMEKTLNSPESRAAGGRQLDAQLNIAKPMRERTAALMRDALEYLNVPTRQDVLRLAREVNAANARLDELQVQLEEVGDAVAAIARLLREQSGERLRPQEVGGA